MEVHEMMRNVEQFLEPWGGKGNCDVVAMKAAEKMRAMEQQVKAQEGRLQELAAARGIDGIVVKPVGPPVEIHRPRFEPGKSLDPKFLEGAKYVA